MGLLRWRWLVSGVLGAVLCIPLNVNITPPGWCLPVAYAKDAVKPAKGKEAPRVEDTKVKDQSQDEGELALIDLGAGILDEPGTEVLADGVTATGNAKAKANAKNAATGQHPLAVLPFDDTRFLILEPPLGAAAAGKSQQAKPGAPQKPAPPKAQQAAKVKPAAQPPGKQPAKAPAKTPASRPATGKFIASLGLDEPPAVPAGQAEQEFMPVGPEVPASYAAAQAGGSDPAAPTLERYFSADELADPASGSTEAAPDGEGGALGEGVADQDLYAGVIPTQSGATAAGTATQPLSQALRDGKNNGIGTNLVALSPWRAVTLVLMVLAFLLAGAWATGKLKGMLPGSVKRSLAVIESITIAPGRQITIVEMHGDALVLGITPQSINLLDKLPLERFNSDYSSTVQTIINREAAALPTEWAKQPAFVAGTGATSFSPPPQRGFIPPPRERISVGELRRARSLAGAGSLAPRPVAYNSRGVAYGSQAAAGVASGRASKDELIDRLRSQLKQLED